MSTMLDELGAELANSYIQKEYICSKIEKLEEAQRLLKSVIHEETPKSVSSRKIDLSALKKEPPKKSLVDLVRDVVELFEDQEFTVANVDDVLEQRGQTPKGKARARIAMSLQSLLRKGVVVRTYKGLGSEPHRYRRITMNDL